MKYQTVNEIPEIGGAPAGQVRKNFKEINLGRIKHHRYIGSKTRENL